MDVRDIKLASEKYNVDDIVWIKSISYNYTGPARIYSNYDGTGAYKVKTPIKIKIKYLSGMISEWIDDYTDILYVGDDDIRGV